VDLSVANPFAQFRAFDPRSFAFDLRNLNGSSFDVNGALDPGLSSVAGLGVNPLLHSGFNPNLGFSNFANGFARPVDFSNPAGFGAFGETSARANALIPSSIARGGLCGDDAYPSVCNGALAQKPAIEQRIDQELDGRLQQFLQSSGTSMVTYQARMAYIAATQAVPPAWRDWYRGYLRAMQPDFEFSDLVEADRKAVIAGLMRQDFSGDLAAAMKTVGETQIITEPNLDDPTETQHFLQTCGARNRSNNAFTCPFHNNPPIKVFICAARQIAALVRSGGNTLAAKADITHTIKHEFAHGIGSEATSPFSVARADVSACFASKNGKAPQSNFNAEMNADSDAAWAMAESIANGDTLGLSPEEYIKRSMSRLCGTGGDHPVDRDRIKLLMDIIKLNKDAAQKLGCSTGSIAGGVCTMKGNVPGRI